MKQLILEEEMGKGRACPVEGTAEPMAGGQGEWVGLDPGSEGLEPSWVVGGEVRELVWGRSFFFSPPSVPCLSFDHLGCLYPVTGRVSSLPPATLLPTETTQRSERGLGQTPRASALTLWPPTGRGPRPPEEAEQLADVHPATPGGWGWPVPGVEGDFVGQGKTL